MRELIIITKEKPVKLRSVLKPEKKFYLTPFLGFFDGLAGVGYIDEQDGGMKHVSSSGSGTVVRSMPIIKAWRAYQVLKQLNRLSATSVYIVWEVVGGRTGRFDVLKELVSNDIDVEELHREVMMSFPSEDEIAHIATETLLADKQVDFEELLTGLEEAGKELPRSVELYCKLMVIIGSQAIALQRIRLDVQNRLRSVANPY